MITSIEEKWDFCDILLCPQVSTLEKPPESRSDVQLKVDGRVPIIVANMDNIGTFEVASVLAPHGLMVAILKEFTIEDWKRSVEQGNLDPRLLIPTLGLSNLAEEIVRVRGILTAFPTIDIVCLDVANGYLHSVSRAIGELKSAFPHIKICAGNVVEEQGLRHLANAGASIIKVGIGSGGVCLTRKMTGIGFPQFSAIADLSGLATSLGVELVSDGGMTDPGAAAKAFAAGASFVMSGSYFAGHEETGLVFHGMSSHGSREKRQQSRQAYRASEGREVVLASRGSLAHTVQELLGGLNSACTYLGVAALGDLRNAPIKAIRVGRQLNRIQGVSSESN